MARKLILVPRSLERLADTTRIEVGYPKEWTEADMRTWADDLDRYYRTTPAELDAWRQSSQLSEEQRRTLAVESHYMTEPDRGIKGDLREDGMIELAGGRHRAGYLVERGVDLVPV